MILSEGCNSSWWSAATARLYCCSGRRRRSRSNSRRSSSGKDSSGKDTSGKNTRKAGDSGGHPGESATEAHRRRARALQDDEEEDQFLFGADYKVQTSLAEDVRNLSL